jgi:glucose-6-phosphate isomerase, archaeal
MLPETIVINPQTGAVSPHTSAYEKRLSEFRGIYRDEKAFDALLAAKGDVVTYKVVACRGEGTDMFFGTTTMYPGSVGDEYFMTRGHFHARRDCGEIYYTQSGEGLLLLQSREGEIRTLAMKPGTCASIPADWAHRTVNTGDTPLVFVWCCHQQAGHEYGSILTRGMGQRVVRSNGAPVCLPDPARG